MNKKEININPATIDALPESILPNFDFKLTIIGIDPIISITVKSTIVAESDCLKSKPERISIYLNFSQKYHFIFGITKYDLKLISNGYVSLKYYLLKGLACISHAVFFAIIPDNP